MMMLILGLFSYRCQKSVKLSKVNKISETIRINEINKVSKINKINQIKSSQQKIYCMGIFFFSSIVVKETRTKLSIFFSCVLREQKRGFF